MTFSLSRNNNTHFILLLQKKINAIVWDIVRVQRFLLFIEIFFVAEHCGLNRDVMLTLSPGTTTATSCLCSMRNVQLGSNSASFLKTTTLAVHCKFKIILFEAYKLRFYLKNRAFKYQY